MESSSECIWKRDSHTTFHAYYQDEGIVIGLNPVDLIAGSLPRRQLRLVEAWAELHEQELLEDWK
jgi:hypothetical protein